MGPPGNCQSPVLAIENVDVRQLILLDVSFDGVHVSQFRSSSRYHPFYHHVQHCSGGMAFISTSDMSIQSQSLLHQVCCYRLDCCCFPGLFISFVLSHANALYPSQHSHFSLIHQHLILLFHCPAFSPIFHSRSMRMISRENNIIQIDQPDGSTKLSMKRKRTPWLGRPNHRKQK